MIEIGAGQNIRNFGKVRDAVEISNLVAIQKKSYADFLQEDIAPTRRKCIGLEALFREIFPIESYDKSMRLEYLYYELEKPRYTLTQCRQLRLTYGYPLKICCRLREKGKQDSAEQTIYLGEMPTMIGGGEFIINGAERVIVSQLHRSPGVDFVIESKEGDRVLHGGRIIPQRGSWIEISVTRKDVLVIKIDQSSKIPATIFLRAIDPAYGDTEAILRLFYSAKTVPKTELTPAMWAVGPIVDTETGEIIVGPGEQISDKVSLIQSGNISPLEQSPDKEHKIASLGFRKVPLLFKSKEYRSLYAEKNNKSLRETLTHEKYAGLRPQIETRYQAYLDHPLGKFLQILKSNNDKSYKDFLNDYGDETYCMFSVSKKEEDVLDKKGLYAFWIGSEIVYVGRCLNSFKKRINQGYGKIHPKNCFIDGQGENCRLNSLISKNKERIEFGVIIMEDDAEIKAKEGELIKALGPRWNIQVKKKVKARHEIRDTQKVEVIDQARDALILNTLAEDDCQSHEQALLKLYMRLRPGNPPNEEKARTFFKEKFFDANRYQLGKVGRFRLNRKFGQTIDEKEMTLRPEDFLNTMKYIMGLRNNKGEIDDIDHLGNRRLRTIEELAGDEIRKGLLKLRKTVTERMSMKGSSARGGSADAEIDESVRIADLVNSKSVSSSINYFFGRGELSQIVDQTNALSQLTHERRLSALGPGGLNRKRAGFEVRDVHISHYGRICPIETPEGTNIGLISSLAIFGTIDEYGFLLTPYQKVINGKTTDQVDYLRADEDMKAIIAAPNTFDQETGKIQEGTVLVMKGGELAQVSSDEVDYVDVSPKQTVGVSASLIPFLEHDDANRALMGSNMQRQAVPLLKAELPLVGTGMEKVVAQNSSMVVHAEKSGVVTAVDATRIVIDHTNEYKLDKFVGLNERTCLNQKPIVRLGEKVKKGQIIADGGGIGNSQWSIPQGTSVKREAKGETQNTRYELCAGEPGLALGKNLLVGFVSFDGFNFEDAIIISEKLVKNESFTSIHIDEFTAEVRETRLGREEFTRDIPNVGEKALRNLDEHGVVHEGTRVCSGDILVGKVAPKSKTELTPEEKLLHAIFGRAGEDVKNDSLEMPSGYEGVVIKTERFTRRGAGGEEATKALAVQIKQYEKQMRAKECLIFRQMIEAVHKKFDVNIVDPSTRQKAGASKDDEVIYEQIVNFDIGWVKPASARDGVQKIVDKFQAKITEIREEKKHRIEVLKHGDELPSGVLEMVKVYVATKRTLSIGDKMAGRHGNKGVIAKIMPEEDMPFLKDGTSLDILLNPLGVPSRMNLGQIFETHLGWVAKVLGFNAITPVFDGVTEDDIQKLTAEANEVMRQRAAELGKNKQAPPVDEFFVNVPKALKTQLYDGRTGEPFDQKATIGYIYMMKLHHLVDDKIHARATGPYSLITQQPLGGKARTGGQRFGEMEVWALEGYGAAYTLQEMLTVKSDDVEGRTKIYESMVKGTNALEAGTPLSFDVLCNEIRGLALNIQLEKKRLGSTGL